MNTSNDKRGIYTLNVDNKDINLLFSMNFWRLLDRQGIKMEELGVELDGSKGVIHMLETLSKVVLAGGQSYAAKHKTEFDYDEDEVFEWFEEEVTDKHIEGMVKVMMETKIFGNSMNQGVKRDAVGKTKPSKK